MKFEGESFSIIVPNSDGIEYEISDFVKADLYLHTSSGNYVPKSLSLDGKVIIRPRMGTIDQIYQDLINDLDSSHLYHVEGDIISVLPINQFLTSSINPIVSNEILNISIGNYDSLENFDNGQYYISENQNTSTSNLVFVSNLEINGVPYVLISVFPLNHIDDIVSAIQLVNIYIFIIVLSVLMSASFIYSKQFAKPLLYINNSTRELSKLNFDSPLLEINSHDEFSELSKNINTLSLNLKSTLDQLKEQNKQLSINLEKENLNENSRRDFVSGMSHELKTPLSVIQASAEALEKNIFESEEDKLRNLILIQTEVKKTNKMINNMLSIYKIDNASYFSKWEIIDFKKIVEKVEDNLRQLYSNSNLKVKLFLDEAQIKGELNKIELVINNLFTNAIKYTPNGETIEVYIRDDGQFIEFEIVNFGSHIESEHLEKLFDPFYRVDKSRSREEGSTGLGLYIVQQALAQYDSICKAANLSSGVSFSFRLKKIINLD
ncbi:MAG: hypothetical protein JXR62_05725 [Bacilli bacterium]|nr:hypothetical protein [Bacilli bacterium]